MKPQCQCSPMWVDNELQTTGLHQWWCEQAGPRPTGSQRAGDHAQDQQPPAAGGEGTRAVRGRRPDRRLAEQRLKPGNELVSIQPRRARPGH